MRLFESFMCLICFVPVREKKKKKESVDIHVVYADIFKVSLLRKMRSHRVRS